MARKVVSCGRDLGSVSNLPETLESAGHDGFDFVSLFLVNPRYKRDHINSQGCHSFANRSEPLTRNDLIMPSGEWMSLIVAKMSPWIQVDSENDDIRINSEKALMEELVLAAHLNVPVVMMSLKNGCCVNLARCLSSHGGKMKSNQAFWIQVPLVDQLKTVVGLSSQESPREDPWEWWNRLRTLFGNERKLCVALVLTESLPSSSVLDRWFGEPIKAVVIPTDVFTANRRGFPVLKRSHQEFLKRFLKLEVQLILTGACRVDTGIQSYYQYLDHLYQSRPPPTGMDSFAKGYNDYLQNPLQPLMDNLDSHTYEIFEKDPLKYQEYEQAIRLALLDKVNEQLKDEKEIVVMVVGAGRGPLVRATLSAASNAQRLVKVYAIEKNPCAVVTLRNLQMDEWGPKVTIVSCDMREWNFSEKADILVSELLGSFGDNELSPECLDGAQNFLKDDGISIPSSYSSYIAPVLAPKLHASIEECKDKDKGFYLAHYETPYVVRLWNANPVSSTQTCFTFHHPNNDSPINNERYVCLKFNAGTIPTMIHGFAGYFDTILYKDVKLSIVPETHSKGMISWFPIFFPLKEPVFVKANETIEFHMWRLNNGKRVWYEWSLTKPVTTSIHNPRGRSYWIGL